MEKSTTIRHKRASEFYNWDKESALVTKLRRRYEDVESFDCPVCLRMVLPPILLVCVNDHVVCNDCLPSLQGATSQRCPKCRQSLLDPPIRSLEAESILQSLLTNIGTVPCHFAPYGCNFFKSSRESDQLPEHELKCAYRIVKLTSDLVSWYDENYTRKITNKIQITSQTNSAKE